MAIKGMTPGTVYFLGEMDVLTGERSDYFKIGIVKGERAVDDRLNEHNTGNPRSVIAIDQIDSPAAQALETRLHNQFAKERVSSNEWFYLPPSRYAVALETAKRLNEELVRFAVEFRVAKEVSGPGSNEALPLSDGLAEIALQAGLAEAKLKLLKSYADELTQRIIAVAEGKSEWDLMIRVHPTPESNRFSAEELKRLNKDLWEQYRIPTEAKYSAKFTLPKADLELVDVLTEYSLNTIEMSGDDVKVLHANYLGYWAVKSELEWTLDLAKARLLAASESAHGIEGVLKWNKPESPTTFDSERFKDEQPEWYEKCMQLKPAKAEPRVVEWASYR